MFYCVLGRPYYMNKYTQKTQWDRPNAPAKKPDRPEVCILFELLVSFSCKKNAFQDLHYD